jgi:hypothetical protein
VIHHLTVRIRAAGAGAGVHTALAHARLAQRAVRAQQALGPTVGRGAKVAGLAGAGWSAAVGAAGGVRAAGVR